MTDAASWLASIIVGGVGAIVGTLIFRWIQSSRSRPAARTVAGTQLQYPTSVCILASIGLAFFGACAWFSFFSPTGGPAVAALFLGFASLSFYLLWEYMAIRYTLRADGLEYRTLSFSRGVAHWEDVAHVRYAPYMKWFVVELRGGRRLRFSVLLIGLPALAQVIQDRLAPMIDDRSLEPVRETAAGRPPAL
jgi:hypothetical protein